MLDAKLAELNALNADKKKVETRIEELLDELKTMNVSRDDPLVTKDGFPRNDIDVNAARAARVELIRLENDFKSLDSQISVLVKEVFTLKRAQKSANSSQASNATKPAELREICKIRTLVSGSCGSEAGLQADDRVLVFNDAKSIAQFPAELVKSQQTESPIKIIVYRPSTEEKLSFNVVVPVGRSLGCHFVPV